MNADDSTRAVGVSGSTAHDRPDHGSSSEAVTSALREAVGPPECAVLVDASTRLVTVEAADFEAWGKVVVTRAAELILARIPAAQQPEPGKTARRSLAGTGFI